MSTSKNTNSPELAAMLSAQSKLKAADKKLAAIEAAMAEQAEKIEQVRAAAPSFDAIDAELGKVLASEAAGLISAEECEKREAELRKKATSMRQAVEDGAKKISRLQATISGLAAQQRETKLAVARAHPTCRDALDAFLMAEAERIGRSYLEHAKTLYQEYLALMALNELHRYSVGSTDHVGVIRGWDAYEFCVPAFRVAGHRDLAPGRLHHRLFIDMSAFLERPIKEATEAERARIEAAGVALTWNDGRFKEGADDDALQGEPEAAAA